MHDRSYSMFNYRNSGRDDDLETIKSKAADVDAYYDSILSVLGLHETALIRYFYIGMFHVR